MFGTSVADMQEDIVVANDKITGKVKKLTSGSLVDVWGEGYFLALKFSNKDADAVSVKVGLLPSEGAGLVELDEDMNGAFKVTNKATQKIEVVQTSADGRTTTQLYSLAELVEVE